MEKKGIQDTELEITEGHGHSNDCTCGCHEDHEHEHGHSDDCTCGCHEAHEHEHGHTDNCTCGCHEDHERDHGHTDNCTCGCHEDHEHIDIHNSRYNIEVTTHESAVICTYSFILDKKRADAEETAEKFISAIGDGVKDSGGFIGHIKASIVFACDGVRISLTDDIVDKQCFSMEQAYVEGVAIVFMLKPDTLKDIAIKGFEAAAV